MSSVIPCRNEAILRVAAQLNVQAARLAHSGEAETAARTLRVLNDLVADHLRTDTDALDVPDNDADPLRISWSQYADFWTVDRIAGQPAAFGETSRVMLAAVIDRVRGAGDPAVVARVA